MSRLGARRERVERAAAGRMRGRAAAEDALVEGLPRHLWALLASQPAATVGDLPPHLRALLDDDADQPK